MSSTERTRTRTSSCSRSSSSACACFFVWTSPKISSISSPSTDLLRLDPAGVAAPRRRLLFLPSCPALPEAATLSPLDERFLKSFEHVTPAMDDLAFWLVGSRRRFRSAAALLVVSGASDPCDSLADRRERRSFFRRR